ncbi:unnamed protein product [Boreogadus saida]
MMDRCRCCVLVAGCAIMVLAVAAVEPVNFQTFMTDCQKSVAKESDGKTSCEEVWSAFEKAYVDKDPCTVLPEAYDDLLSVAPPRPKRNRMLFWSGTKAVADKMAGGYFQTIADTLLGSVLDGKDWCGKKGSKETFTGSDCVCKGYDNAALSFWRRASAKFAEVAEGKVYVLLNGDRQTPFYDKTIFAEYEVQGFNPDRVTNLTVVLVTKDKVVSKIIQCMKIFRKFCEPHRATL